MTQAVKWWIAIALVVVFMAGVATGLLAGARHARHLFFARHSAHFGPRMEHHLKRQLGLTPEQSEKVAPILERMSSQLAEIREETGRRVAQTMGESHREIAPILTPEQRAKLDKMKERHRRILQRRGDLPSHPHGP